MNKKLLPFIKWAGGKRQLLQKIKEKMPVKYNNYYEPFVGGGALLFELQPTNATINDINKELITTYIEIRKNVNEFIKIINKLDSYIYTHGKEYYCYSVKLYNQKILNSEYDTELASLFVFINHHCFNGLYRVNKKGLFNVPYNNNLRPSINETNIYNISEYLSNVNILNGDFEEALVGVRSNDFVFIDSPYAQLNKISFDSYTKTGFSIEDHKRLSELYDKLTKNKVYSLLTNHNTELINELYKDYNIELVNVKRMINSDSHNRTGKEVIITNY